MKRVITWYVLSGTVFSYASQHNHNNMFSYHHTPCGQSCRQCDLLHEQLELQKAQFALTLLTTVERLEVSAQREEKSAEDSNLSDACHCVICEFYSHNIHERALEYLICASKKLLQLPGNDSSSSSSSSSSSPSGSTVIRTLSSSPSESSLPSTFPSASASRESVVEMLLDDNNTRGLYGPLVNN